MHIDPGTGLLTEFLYVHSPNADERPPGVYPELIVVHGISLPPGKFGGPWIDQLFTNRLDALAHPYFAAMSELKVSAHALIRRGGEVVQYVPFQRRAWHAGESSYRGRERCNDFSIGIELEGADDFDYAVNQYHTLAAMIRALVRTYPSLSRQHIVGHEDVAPGRKTDPGPVFDWRRLHGLLGGEK
jgi:N-acetyl-anhydromuramoyl-L-alanine amidase